MNKNIEVIQDKLIKNLIRLDEEQHNLNDEVSRSNAISQLANTYIKTCNLVIRVEESKEAIKNKINETQK